MVLINTNNEIEAVKYNPAVPKNVLIKIFERKQAGATAEDALRLFYKRGRREDSVDVPRSILAQLEYQHKVLTWDKNGVSFSNIILCSKSASRKSSIKGRILPMFKVN